MNKNAFDELLRQNVIYTTGMDLFGYGIGNRNYPNYYCPSAFAIFVNQMMKDSFIHYEKYNAGKGSELKQYGDMPPKMASVASSSRFCYLALSKGTMALGGSGEVDFEHSCPIKKIKGGTPPQMDAYVRNENIFIEVKCHEIFDSHKIILSDQYFDHLYGVGNDFGFENIPKGNAKTFEIPLSSFGANESSMLDIKQLICHLLGIKYHKEQDEQATLVYLFFKPKTQSESQRIEIEQLFNDLTKEVEMVFNSKPIRNFAINNNIELKAVAEYSEVMSPLTKENMISLYT